MASSFGQKLDRVHQKTKFETEPVWTGVWEEGDDMG
jgi:hypothetical protein